RTCSCKRTRWSPFHSPRRLNRSMQGLQHPFCYTRRRGRDTSQAFTTEITERTETKLVESTIIIMASISESSVDFETRSESKLLYSALTGEILSAAFEVHRELGPGLLESAY